MALSTVPGLRQGFRTRPCKVSEAEAPPPTHTHTRIPSLLIVSLQKRRGLASELVSETRGSQNSSAPRTGQQGPSLGGSSRTRRTEGSRRARGTSTAGGAAAHLQSSQKRSVPSRSPILLSLARLWRGEARKHVNKPHPLPKRDAEVQRHRAPIPLRGTEPPRGAPRPQAPGPEDGAPGGPAEGRGRARAPPQGLRAGGAAGGPEGRRPRESLPPTRGAPLPPGLLLPAVQPGSAWGVPVAQGTRLPPHPGTARGPPPTPGAVRGPSPPGRAPPLAGAPGKQGGGEAEAAH
nr:basic salivary proline-rich protein 4-like [Vulpes vulpes]